MRHSLFLAVITAATLCACAAPEKKEEVPSKDTFECTLKGERYVVRFVDAEARILTPDGTRVILYQIPAASGVRFTNGLIELRGKGMQLQLVEDGLARSLEECRPVMVPKEEPSALDKLLPMPGQPRKYP
jgi:membrane-bound inhibitor of C-type lysozyme